MTSVLLVIGKKTYRLQYDQFAAIQYKSNLNLLMNIVWRNVEELEEVMLDPYHLK